VMTAFEIARYGLIIETGRVGLQGTTAMLADDPGIRQAYLGL
jgi:ABC-type branched-subunit amino acid transport system ATPase component